LAFIRLSDDYFDNPKIEHLSDGAFRLWHQALAYCRRHSTDGLFSVNTMHGWRCWTKQREKQLSTAHVDGANPLWVAIPRFGYKVHDYLAWNLSREEEAAERIGAAERMRRHRAKRKPLGYAVTSGVTNDERGAFVPGMGMVTEIRSEKTEDARASLSAESFMDEFRATWKSTYGYECSLLLSPLQFADLQTQLDRNQPETLRGALQAYFATSDPFVLRAKHALALFLKDPAKYLAPVKSGAADAEFLAGVRAEIARQDAAVKR